jgi:uncharacterized protein
MWTKFASFILRNRWAVLVGWLLLVGVMTYFAQFAEVNLKPGRILPHNEAVWQDYQKFRATFGEEANTIFIAVESHNFPQELGEQWEKLESNLKSLPGVEWVLSPASVSFLQRNDSLRRFTEIPAFPMSLSQVTNEQFRARLDSLPLYKGILWDSEITHFVMLSGLDKEIIHTKSREGLIASIEEHVADFENSSGVEVHISGLPFIRTDTIRRSSKEIILFVALAGLITAVVLYLFFKSFIAIFVPLLVVGSGVACSSALLHLLGFKITSLTGLIPPLLIVIGVPNAVYMITKYHQEFSRHGNKILALTRVVYKTGKAIFLTNLTTAIGFGTLVITNSSMLIEFGVLASLSVLMLFALSIFLIPVLFSFFPAPASRHIKHLKRKGATYLLRGLSISVSRRRGLVYVISASLLVFSVSGMLQIRPSGMVSDDIPKNSRTYRDLEWFENVFGGVIPFEFLIDSKKPGTAGKDLKFLHRVQDFQDSLNRFPQISAPISVTSFLKAANQAYFGGNYRAYRMPNSPEFNLMAEYFKGNTEVSVSTNLTQAFLDSSKQVLRIQARVRDMGTYEMNALKSDLEKVANSVFEPFEEDVVLTGAGVVMLKATDYLVKNLFLSLALAILFIALIMSVMFRSFKMVFISLIPNLMPLLFTAGFMGWAGIPLKASTCLIFSVAFGISVDDTIHFLSRYRQELQVRSGMIKPSVFGALGETGLSMTYTSVILFFGFSIFLASEFGSTVALGMLVSITLLVAMFTNLTLLPALLIGLQKNERDENYRTYPNFEDPDNEQNEKN